MSKTIAVVIQEDPRKTHRPVEALRIALGLAAGAHQTTVVLLNEAIRLLSEDTDDIVDVDILEQYLPSFKHLEIPFLLEKNSVIDHGTLQEDFKIQFESQETIREFLQSVDRSLIF